MEGHLALCDLIFKYKIIKLKQCIWDSNPWPSPWQSDILTYWTNTLKNQDFRVHTSKMLPVFLKYLNCNLYLLSIGTLLHFDFSILPLYYYCIFRVNYLFLVVRVNWSMETKQEPLHVLKNRYTCIYSNFHILNDGGSDLFR